MSLSIKKWGMTDQECLIKFPYDNHMDVFDDVYYRGVTIQASPEIIFRWLCQMRVAPYSYDYIDNFGRKSPQTLLPGLDQLEIGQDVIYIFDLVDFEKNNHFTCRIKKNTIWYKIFGDNVVSYLIIPVSKTECRLLVKLLVKYPRGVIGLMMQIILPLGDRIMMRRQLLNFKKLSEKMQNSI